MTDKAESTASGTAVHPIEMDAAAVAAAPVLGYEIGEPVRPGDVTTSPRQLRQHRRWIVSTTSPVTIDIELFAEWTPFDALLFDGATTSTEVSSLGDELGKHWTISTRLSTQLDSAPPIPAVSVVGGGVTALVWADGMIIGATEPLATALNLLIEDFSQQARRAYVYADRRKLQDALDVLPADVKARHVPDADNYLTQADHELAIKRQQDLKPRAPQIEFVNGKLQVKRPAI